MKKKYTFKFLKSRNTNPKRVVILGSSGIVSTNLQKILREKKIKTLTIGSSKLDLKKDKASKILKSKIKKKDVIIFIAAEAPVKNMNMLFNNLKICKNVCDGLKNKKVEQLIYISSDAVYSDTKYKISESSETLPESLHGLMHLNREFILKKNFEKTLCILRSTLIYGIGDSHNGYGPNRFVKLALKDKPISIFGNGEEKRDHIFIDDLIKIIIKCIEKKGLGVLNLASGNVYSFKYIAEIIVNLSNSKSKLNKLKRLGPMPHNGYRPFDIKLLNKYFKDVQFLSLQKSIYKYIKGLVI